MTERENRLEMENLRLKDELKKKDKEIDNLVDRINYLERIQKFMPKNYDGSVIG